MKKITLLACTLVCTSFSVIADYVPNTEAANASSSDSSTQQDLVNLGGYLGYVLSKAPSNISDTLLDYTSSTSNQEIYEQAALVAFFGAQPVDTITSMLAYFVPPSANNSSTLNNLANVTNTAYGDYGTVSKNYPSVVQYIDVPTTGSSTYENDPTSQALVNILTTNDYSVCNAIASQGSSSSTSSNAYPISTPTCVSQASALETILNLTGSQSTNFPGASSFGTYQYVQSFLGQINANVVLSPLLYTNSSSSSQSSSNSTETSSTYNGLPSANQEDQAADFIRYAIGIPMGLASASSYTTMWNNAFPSGTGNISANQSSATIAAQELLAAYLVNLRTYAARSSIPISNLYQIFAKREPQPLSFNNSTTSQALSEFEMATWRIYNSQNSQSDQWVDQINTASAATVSKEIAILLSEINYQLYLTRQIAERQLMTTSVALLVSMGTGPVLQQTYNNQ